ncbi:leucyl aminopeptidase [Methanocella sp. CWC-04]|uniref:Leucyl aminopeptidase n=1 Tax=Methanooceanicella nereidis TaxID=2052831 RepID=A0AAP2RF76_9EURY|nr:aminopeptidase [Methanocella sp. CWC-04]MCD1295731.1 leucyl aminopeptidase [Methanocella sp. CWC-04]
MDIKKSAMIAVKDCMGVKPHERVLIVTDSVRKDIGIPLYDAAIELGCDALYMEMKPRSRSGEEPPKAVADSMLEADVVIAATKVSLSHTEARRNACRKGARIASIPIQEADGELVMKMFSTGGMRADYAKMEENIDRLLERLKDSSIARITTALGTDVTIEFGGREFHKDTGIAHNTGDFTNLPGGEIYLAPTNVNGKVVIDGSFGDYGLLRSPLELIIKDRHVVSAKGDRADDLENTFELLGKDARNIAELGIGMNPTAKLWGILLEDEKVGNTIHIALGDNTSFGGDVSVPMHYDGIVTAPTVIIDGEKINLNDYL